VHSLLCGREALSNELCEAVGVLRASCRLRRKHSVFGADAANDVILRRLPYPASQHFSAIRYRSKNPSPRPNRREIEYVRNPGYRATPEDMFFGPGGTPKTHLVPQFCHWRKATVMTKHFLSAHLDCYSPRKKWVKGISE